MAMEGLPRSGCMMEIFLFYKESTSPSSRWTSCPCWMHTKHHIRISSGFRLHGLMVHSTLLVGVSINIHGHKPSPKPPQCYKHCRVVLGSQEICMIIETSFIINLLILSSWTSYNKHAPNGNSSDGKAALVYASNGVALLPSFVSSSIGRYQTYLYLKSTKLYQCFRRHTIKKRNITEGREG